MGVCTCPHADRNELRKFSIFLLSLCTLKFFLTFLFSFTDDSNSYAYQTGENASDQNQPFDIFVAGDEIPCV